MVGTEAVGRLRAALAARDLEGVLAATSERVVVEVEGAPAVLGRDALRTWLEELLRRTADSRWLVHVSTRTPGPAPVVEEEVTVAWRPADLAAPWVVAAAAVRLDVVPGDGPFRHARIRIDRGAVAAQLAGASRLPATSVRSDVALATFDPDAPSPVPVERVLAPAAAGRQGRRRGAALLVGELAVIVAVVVLAGLLGGGLLPGGDGQAGGPGAAGDNAGDGAGDTAGDRAGDGAQPTARDEAVVELSAGAGTGAGSGPSPGASPVSPGLLGEAAVVDDSGTVTLSLSETVLFDPGSSDLRPEAVAVVDDVAATLFEAGGGELLVVGHTDSVGADEYNLGLSQQRAEAVAAVLRDDLAGTGVTVRAEGRGSTEPVADEASSEGRQANRRVELRYDPPAG